VSCLRAATGRPCIEEDATVAIRRHLTYANVMATGAVFIALGGSSYAAATLSRNSVGSEQIKDRQVMNADLAANAVTSTKIKDGSVLPGDLKPGSLPVGPKGSTGPTGAQGATGPSGVSGAHLVEGALATIAAANGFGTATVTCPAGERILSGNYNQIDGVPSITVFRTRIINAGTTFQADGKNTSALTDRQFSVYAICAA
jgi:hypothetical protein